MSNTSPSEISSVCATTNTCANCGKEGSDVTNTCNKCKMVMYCNAACKKRHRHKHKKECERRVTELHDEKIFKQPPTLEDCPICMIRLPTLATGRTYMACCGKLICCGCIRAFQSRAVKAGRIKEDDICPFCRTPPPKSDEAMIKRYKKRMELNDPIGIRNLAGMYVRGLYGLPQNITKALELWHRGAELGSADAYYAIGIAYNQGRGVRRNEKEAMQYWELAAMSGSSIARHNLGCFEEQSSNYDRALRHWMIAATDGDLDSLKKVKSIYMDGHATKDDYAKALRSYQSYLHDIKSDQRDQAAAYDARNKYYESAV